MVRAKPDDVSYDPDGGAVFPDGTAAIVHGTNILVASPRQLAWGHMMAKEFR